jgi:hypothetical protein
MVLDEGWFVASSNSGTGIEYDYDNAIEFVADPSESEGVVFAVAGEQGKKDTWVNELMISTIRGNDAAFKAATIKPTASNIESGEWGGYTTAQLTKIKLPAAGVWKIQIDPGTKEICFTEIEGEEPVVKEPVDIVTNPTEVVIEAVERNYRNAEEAGLESLPEGYTVGNTWDNQFFLYPNRTLTPGEVTVLEFDYSATKEANSSVAFQGIVGDNQNDYITGAFNMEGDAAFGTTEKHLTKELTMPAKKWSGEASDGVNFITFDLAVIKEANTYTFKNIKWYLKNDTEGKTLENLINATGTDNFKIKIGAGTAPQPMGIETVVDTKVTSSESYNLAGQRVSKDYKGIVVKGGKKFVVK